LREYPKLNVRTMQLGWKQKLGLDKKGVKLFGIEGDEVGGSEVEFEGEMFSAMLENALKVRFNL